MAVSSIKDFWIHPNALTITLNYFGDPQLIQTSMLAGAVIMAYRKDVISYDAAHNFREWKLQAFPTQLNDTCAYYVHAELSRSGDTAMIIYSPVKRDLEGRSLLRVELDVQGNEVEVWDTNTSPSSFFIYLGQISASVDSQERMWVDGFHTGTLATDQHRMEEAQGDWAKMFQLNAVTDLIEFLKGVASAVFNQLSVVFEFTFQGNKFTNVAKSSDSGDKRKWSDSTLPTAGYVAEEILDLDDHFLIKDQDNGSQSVESEVSFKKDVSIGGDTSIDGDIAVKGNSSIGGDSFVEGKQIIGDTQTIGRDQEVCGAQLIGGTQEVKGRQTLHEGFITEPFSEAGGQILGAHLTKNGFLTLAGLKTISFEVFELVYNQIRSQGGAITLSSSATIEDCKYEMIDGSVITPSEYDQWLSNNPYSSWVNGEDKRWHEDSWPWIGGIDNVLLTIKKDDVNTSVPFRNGDILYGYVNKIGDSGEYAKGGQCVMYVTSANLPVDGDPNSDYIGKDGSMTIRCKLFYIIKSDESIYDEYGKVREGVVVSNIPPTSAMDVAQRGNVDPEKNGDRLSAIFLDSTKSCIYMLSNVSKPILDTSNYAVVSGQLPTDLWVKVNKEFPSVKQTDPVSYSKYLVAENFLQFDHLGTPIKRENNRGAWSKTIAESENADERYKNTPNYYDTVTHEGQYWKCIDNDTTEEPGTGAGWLLLVASGKGIGANLIQNSNFDVYDADGNLLYFEPAYGNSKQLGYVVKGGFDGYYNSYNYGDKTYRVVKIKFPFNVKKNTTYTFSFQYKLISGKYDYLGFLFYVPTNKVDIFNIDGIDTADHTNRYDVWCDKKYQVDGWSKKSFSFKYTPQEGDEDVISDSYIELYKYDSSEGEIAQIKIEEGAISTPYLKSQEDLKGKDGVVANENLLPDTEWKYSGTTDYYAVKGWTANITGTATLSYLVVNEKAYDIHSTLQIKSSTKVYIDVQKSNIPLSDNTVYTLSMMVKQETPLFVEFQTATSAKLDQITLSCEYSNTIGLGVGKGISSWKGVLLDNLPASSDFQQVIIRIQTGSLGGSVKMSLGVKAGGLTATLCLLKLERGTIATPYQKAYADYATVAGPAGKPGPMIYPMGEWNENLTYKKTDDTAPYVYYDNNSLDDTEGKYYVLNVVESTGVSPAKSNEHWRQMTQFEAIYTKFLMANFAQFGSDEGAIFWHRYLFSQYGAGGDKWSLHKSEMFDETTKLLTGKFMPKLHLDFYNGLANFSCLCQPFYTPTPKDGYIKMDPSKGFNISIPSAYIHTGSNIYRVPDETEIYNTHYPVVILPQFKNNDEWMGNGAHVTVRFESGGESYGNLFGGVGNNYKDYRAAAQNIFLLISVDDISSGFSYPSLSWSGNYIFNNGRRGKYMILSQGAFVTLKSTQVGSKMYWIVENSGSVKEEVVDVYASLISENTNINTGSALSDATVNSYNFDRHQFYGADYSDDVILKTDYYGGGARGIFFYSGAEGFCPKSILYSNNSTGHYRRLNLDQGERVDSSLTTIGPTII